jgi:hypothetical protein
VNNQLRKPPNRLPEKPRRKSPERRPKRGTMAGKMTRGHPRRKLGIMLLQGDTTQSSTGDAWLVETDSETSHGRSTRNSAGLNTKENRFVIH